MKIQVAKQDLVAALQAVGPSLGSGNPGDISNHFLFRVVRQKDDSWKAQVLTYTGQLCAMSPFVSNVEIEDSEVDDNKVKGGHWPAFTIEGKRLKTLLKTFSPAALTLDHEGAKTKVSAPRGTQVFESLDPLRYPVWDNTLEAATSIATVPADALGKAFSWVRLFVSDDEASRPDLCIFESREGIIRSSNRYGAVLVTVPQMEKSTLRVHGKDAGALIEFLSKGAGGEVEVLECDRALYLRRSDGAVFGEYRYNVKFPENNKLGMIKKDPQWWDVPIADFDTALQFLRAGASNDDNRLRFKAGTIKGTIALEMERAYGGEHATQAIPCEMGSEDGAQLRDKGFLVDHTLLAKVLGVAQGETLRFGIHQRKKSGFLRFGFAEEGVVCQMILAWLKE